jgi:capsule biosynthesis protein GfcC
MRAVTFAWLVPLALAMAGAHAGTIDVTARGAVARAGAATYADDARLSTVARAIGVSPTAYTLGAAWLQPALHVEQLRLKAGLMYELGAIRRQAIGNDDDATARGAASFQAWFDTLPVTGRRLQSVLDPARLDVSPSDDRPVHVGDTLVYPARPSTVRIVGAVAQPCRLPQVAMQDARRYLASCPASKAADPDAIYVVQPDGAVFEQNIALWNRAEPRPLAPGAWIYVPFNRHVIAGAADETFNHDIATFLATQLLDGDQWQ